MGDKGRGQTTSTKSYAELWVELETQQAGMSDEALHALLKALLVASTELEKPAAAFTLRRVRVLERVLCSERPQVVLYVACTLVHLACAYPERHEHVTHGGLVAPLCDALEWKKGDLSDDTAAGKIRVQILAVVVSTILQLSSGSVKTHHALHAEHAVQRLLHLVNPKTSPLFVKSKDKTGLPELVKNKNFAAKCSQLQPEDVESMSEEFYQTVSPDGKPNELLFKPKLGYVTDLYASKDEHSHVAWELAASGTVWVSHERLASDTWLAIRPTAFISKRLFWAQLGEDAQDKHRAISDHLRHFPHKLYVKCRPAVGAFVGYHCKLTDIYHRCQVIKWDGGGVGEGRVVVLCLDTGRVFHILRTEELFLLLPEMQMKRFPSLAVLCKLHGVSSPPLAPHIIENALTALFNLATVQDRLDVFCVEAGPGAGECWGQGGLVALGRCGQFSVMWRALRVLSNLAHSPPARQHMLSTDLIPYTLSLCEKYPDLSSQQSTDVRALLQAALRLLGNLMWECDAAKDRFTQLNGIEILTGLIKSSTADVTSEAFQSLKSYLGRAVVRLLSVEDIRALKPQTREESDVLSSKVDALLKAQPDQAADTSSSNSLPEGTRRLGSSGVRNRTAVTNTVIAPSTPLQEPDAPPTLQEPDVSSHCFIRNEACGFVEDETHLFLQAENNRVEHISHKAVIQLACSFLNSERGGSVYLGLAACGTVVGMAMTWHQRDELRQGLDMGLGLVRGPGPIMPDAYAIRFTPVHKTYWHPARGKLQEHVQDLYVAEIYFAPNHSNQLYYLKETEVFLRKGKHTVEASALDIQKRQILHLEKEYVMEVEGLQAEIARLKTELLQM